jgi:hypothetical protein
VPASSPTSLRLGSRTIYYGWIIVAALSISETITWGIVYYAFPVFLRPTETDPQRGAASARPVGHATPVPP